MSAAQTVVLPFTYGTYEQARVSVACMQGIPADGVSDEDCWAYLIGDCEEGAITLLWPKPFGYAARVDALHRILPAFEAMVAAEGR